MRKFYHPMRERFGISSVPHILGLTASGIHTKMKDLKTLESNIKPVAVSPQIHRDELLRYIHRPDLVRLVYATDGTSGHSAALSRLCNICTTMNRPSTSVNTLQTEATADLGNVGSRFKWREQLTKFQRKAQYLFETLGPWCADFFILESIKILKELSNDDHTIFFNWTHDERYRLVNLLGQDATLCQLELRRDHHEILVSPKVAALLSFLVARDPSESKTLIFVEQRVTASVLSTLLSVHPSVRGHFHCASFVGLSNSSSKKYNMPELLDLKTQSQALTDFRAQAKNIMVATNALEEGIDVQACNIVVCFDLPKNVRSFIQRRGRARHARSLFALMFEEQESQARLHEWEELERELQGAYQDAARQKEDPIQLESTEQVNFVLEAQLTGAKLTADEAVAHLHHFCSCLPPQPYTDLRPTFSFTHADPLCQWIRGMVTLPNCVDSSVRCVPGKKVWETELAAAKDAAFQCYAALYNTGLLNDNLLPLRHGIDLQLADYEELGARVEISSEFNPWADVSGGWSSASVHEIATTFHVRSASLDQTTSMVVTLPCHAPSLPPLRAYWDFETTIDISFSSRGERNIDSSYVQLLKQITHVISRSTHSDQSLDDEDDFLALFTPNMDVSTLPVWLEAVRGRVSVVDILKKTHTLKPGFLRNPGEGGRPEVLQEWRDIDHQGYRLMSEVEGVPITKRRNFTLPVEGSTHASGYEGLGADARRANVYPASGCTVDRLPAEIAQLNLLLPLVLQHFQHGWMIDLLLKTVLNGVPFKDSDVLVTALTAPSLQWKSNYESLEFLGDSVLKLIVSSQLYDQHQNWPEGYLTQKRAILVSNTYLAGAALKAGLAPFIRTKPISWKKWWPIFTSDLDAETKSPRTVRTKVLADVVEALVGAAFVDGGLGLARRCIHKFLPVIGRAPPSFDTEFSNDRQVPDMTRMEAVVGYKFRRPFLLLEALTHPSCENDHLTQSYQRLEFLGDAALDAIIASQLLQHGRKTSPGEMSRIKAAMANGHLLGFFCLEFAYANQFSTVLEASRNNFNVTKEVQEVHLWQFMRCHSEAVIDRRCESVTRFQNLGSSIRRQIEHGLTYPWLGLTFMRPEKFFSDIMESLLGSLYVDSRGCLNECTAFLERIGMIAYFQRLIDEDVDVVHPRTKLDWKTGSSTVDCKVTRMRRDGGKYSCAIIIDDQAFLQVDGCDTSDEAIISAAQTALEKLDHGLG